MHRSYLLFLLLLGLFSCTQENLEPNIIRVPDNTPPPDPTVSRVVKENYVNKLYITLLGRKVSELEMQGALQLLDENASSIEGRKNLISLIQSDPDYYHKQFDFMRINLLNNLDTTEITQQLRIINLLYDDPQYESLRELLEYEKGRLIALRQAPRAFAQKNIDRILLHRRCVDNLFYDEINMGTQNFILSMFEFFLGRNPTTAEEIAAIEMVDGSEAVLFGEIGDNKEEFLDIFFGSDNYFEGEVIAIYQNFLYRDPNTLEMSEGTQSYRLSEDYDLLIREILSTDEYLGID